MISKVASLAYGTGCYLVFAATQAYFLAFLYNLVPRAIDLGPESSRGAALAVNVALLLFFALQHSVMARPGFKRLWTRVVPEHLERSTYVLAASLALLLLFWQWRPIPGIIWEVHHPVLVVLIWPLAGLGWGLATGASFLIDHFDLFGLRQVYLHATGQPYTPPPFSMPSLYRWVRHPAMTGLVVGLWATPRLTVGHLLFAGVMSAYVVVGVLLEERDLRRVFGEQYEVYRQRVGMFLPRVRSR